MSSSSSVTCRRCHKRDLAWWTNSSGQRFLIQAGGGLHKCRTQELRRKKRKTVAGDKTCDTCGKRGLRWHHARSGRWVLVEASGAGKELEMHDCSKTRTPDDKQGTRVWHLA